VQVQGDLEERAQVLISQRLDKHPTIVEENNVIQCTRCGLMRSDAQKNKSAFILKREAQSLTVDANSFVCSPS